MIDEMVLHLQTQYLQYCDPQIPHHRIALGLAAVVEWRCWSIFWPRTPKQYREAVVSPEIRQTVLAKSVSLVESLNLAPEDKGAQKLQWHIGGHACFQSIMHIVSELKTPELQAPHHRALRSRALEVLKGTMGTRGREVTPMWNVISRIISNCIARNVPPTFLPLTPFRAVFRTNGELSGTGSLTTSVPAETGAPSLPVSRAPSIVPPLPDLSEVESLHMQDLTMAFDWGFWNFDPTDPGCY
ncbi:hypothetical protein ASPZODRAFT_1298351 [Penicilliopsis zonata CBS 506.65]|uniref:Transcription factor domain-containing protein n=1 Tax=Penicilliopsis zonata CBS 506.65 TaxID=1073090 RepID=A0A1L9S6D1_9EURO|nr:hypothetical protein ASPZODRAFT_1298351 [Penicilliopsis zonata CBS 506.65]OJJ42731.1 hypothetical protein ASPZODRAFT_1298351 [Penicilliopsis zonata CBS 506.65]